MISEREHVADAENPHKIVRYWKDAQQLLTRSQIISNARNSVSCSLAGKQYVQNQVSQPPQNGKGGQAGSGSRNVKNKSLGHWAVESELKACADAKLLFLSGSEAQMHVHGDGRNACAAAHTMQGPSSSTV